MTLRRQLMLLHIAFVVFAMAAALTTVYLIQVQLLDAGSRFERVVNRLNVVLRLKLDIQTLNVSFYELVYQHRQLDEDVQRQLDSVLTRLFAVSRQIQANDVASVEIADRLAEVHTELKDNSARLLNAIRASDPSVLKLFKEDVEPWLLSGTSLLDQFRVSQESAQRDSVKVLGDDNRLILIATICVAIVGVVLVMIGTWLVRERLLEPLQTLQSATKAYARGELDHRVAIRHQDELAMLGSAMNSMAAALDGSQRKYQSLFENMRDTVIVCDSQTRVIECQRGDSNLLGFSPKEVLKHSAAELWPEWHFGGLGWRELIARVIDSGRLQRISDVKLPLRNGSEGNADVVAYPAHNAQTSGSRVMHVAIALRDVSERQQLEQAARRGETMEASVTLARGVAHDFKNLLQNAVGSLTQLESKTADPIIASRARAAMIACEQAARLSKRLSRLAADDPGQPEVLDLCDVVQTILDSIDTELVRGVQVEIQMQPDLKILADLDQITRVCLNLIYNACEAMPEGGALRITGRCIETVNPLSPLRPANYIELTVADTGVGMSPEVKTRVFEPLYSTKARNNDGPRGLGLAVVYSVVIQQGGFIQVESREGHGTTFQVYFSAYQSALKNAMTAI